MEARQPAMVLTAAAIMYTTSTEKATVGISDDVVTSHHYPVPCSCTRPCEKCSNAATPDAIRRMPCRRRSVLRLVFMSAYRST